MTQPADNDRIQQFLERVGGDRRLARRLLKIFVKDIDRTVAALRDAIHRTDEQKIRAYAHSLRGSLGLMSLGQAVKLANHIYQHSWNSVEELSQQMSELETATTAEKAFAKELLESIPSSLPAKVRGPRRR